MHWQEKENAEKRMKNSMKKLQHKENGYVNLILQCLLPVLIYYIIHNTAAVFGLSVLQILKEKMVWELAKDSFWFYTETFVKMAAMALGGLAVYPYFKKEKADKLPVKLKIRDSILLIVTGSILSIGINFLFSITGFTAGSDKYQQVAEVQFALPLWLGCIFYGVFSPVVEELVFRGIAYNVLKRYIAEKMAMIGAALLFGAMHGNVVQMIYGTLMGMVLAFVYQKYQNLLAPILLHGAANVSVYALTYFF